MVRVSHLGQETFCTETLISRLLPRSRLAAPLGWSGLLLAALTCAFPSDEGGGVFVTIDAPSDVLVRGDSVVLVARAWRRNDAGQQEQVGGVSFHWFSPESAVVAVHDRHDRSAAIFGLNTGSANVFAVPVDYEGADAGLRSLRVANSVEIDSVVPDTVSYGQQVTIYATGLGRVSRVLLGEANLLPDSASFLGDPLGAGQERFWVPYPARSDLVLAVAQEGFSAPAAETTVVIRHDVFDRPGAAPAEVRLPSAAGPDSVLFENPALALTGTGDNTRTIHFIREDTARAVTFVVTTAPDVLVPFDVILAIQPWTGILPDDETWATGVEQQFCKQFLAPTPSVAQAFLPYTSVQALTFTPGRDIYLSVVGRPNQAGRFAVQVLDGYRLSDPRISPDRFEENDECLAADQRFADPATRIETFPFADTLTLDNPFDVDWLRFRVPVLGTDTARRVITIRTESRPFGAADSSNLNISLYRAIDFIEGLDAPLAQSDQPGSSEAVTSELIPGQEYYLLVLDGAGVPTRYSLCMGEGASCTFPVATIRSPPSGPAR